MSSEMNNLYEFEGFLIDLDEQTLWYENERISLAPRVLETLCVLIENSGRLMTKDELMDEIWGDTFVEERNLTQNIFTLRKEFKKKKKGIKFIETVPRRGYRFVAELQTVEITQEETLAVNHKKKMHITAEGSVSKQELTEAVKEIAKDLIQANGNEKNETKKIESAKSSFFVFSGFKFAITTGLLVLILFAAGIWSWQNDYLDFRKFLFVESFDATEIKFERLTDSGNAFFPTISPDKQFLAYILNEDEKFSIILRNIANGSEMIVIPPKDFEIRSPQFSVDGSYLFYGARDGKMETTVYRVPIFGGSPEQIVTNVNHNFSISPDGEQLAYFRYNPKTEGNQLLICRNDGSNERIISEKNKGKAFRVWSSVPGWSPDGKKLAVVVMPTHAKADGKLKRPFLVEIDVESGDEKSIKSPVWENIMSAQWKTDGDSLIVLAQEIPSSYFRIFHLSYPSGESQLLTNDIDNFTEFSLAPNDEFIIATEERNPYNLQLISIENPLQVHSLTNSTRIQNGSSGMDWTPDGKYLVHSRSVGMSAADIWKINIETEEQTRLTFDNNKSNKNISVSPDGEKIYYITNRTGENQIWRMNPDGSEQQQITDFEGGANHPQISTDGKWLIYSTPAIIPKYLWKRLINGGKAVKILTNSGGTSHISPDMTKIIAGYYDANEKEKNPWKYILIPFENAGTPDIIKSFKNSVNLSWNPNSRGFYFLTFGQSHMNIHHYSLEDDSITPITNYESQVMLKIAVSPDGKTIAAARGKRSSNLFKITGF